MIREPIWALNKIKIKDNNEPLVKLSDYCPNLVVDLKPEVLEHEKFAYVRLTVAEMLHKASLKLKNGNKLRVWDAWRDPVRQKKKYDFYFAQLKRNHPSWPNNILRRETNRMLFPVDEITPPPHSTGAAVDLTIVDSYGNDFDMMSPFEERYQESVTFSTKINLAAYNNRKLLYEIMTSVGFTNYSFEWWHYTFGDSAWALRLNLENAIYGKTFPIS